MGGTSSIPGQGSSACREVWPKGKKGNLCDRDTGARLRSRGQTVLCGGAAQTWQHSQKPRSFLVAPDVLEGNEGMRMGRSNELRDAKGNLGGRRDAVSFGLSPCWVVFLLKRTGGELLCPCHFTKVTPGLLYVPLTHSEVSKEASPHASPQPRRRMACLLGFVVRPDGVRTRGHLGTSLALPSAGEAMVSAECLVFTLRDTSPHSFPAWESLFI